MAMGTEMNKGVLNNLGLLTAELEAATNAPDTSEQYFDMVMRVWSDRGWPTRTISTSRPSARAADTPDGYGLSLTQSVNGYLGMAGATPSFAGSEPGDPLPARIDHPALSRN